MSDPTPVLQARNLAVSIDGRWILQDLDIAFERGSFVAIVGPNGAGKSTLVRALGGLIPSFGRLTVAGVAIENLDLATRARAIAYLPQGHVFHWPMPVIDVVALGRLPHGAGAGSLSVEDRRAVLKALAQTETEAFAERPVTTLSGGEKARVSLARVLAGETPVILADEPTASLDPRYQLLFLAMLRHQAEQGTAVLAVLHDLALAARFADRVVVLEGGKVVADGAPQDVLTPERLAETFGVEATMVERDGVRVLVPWDVSEHG